MTLEERAGLFYHVNTCGSPMGVDFADLRYMFGTESIVPDESSSFTSRSMWCYINVLNITSHLDNTNGTPAQQIVYHNAMQALAEDSRPGIPVVISNDREYNAWGGMIDVAHDAFGAANDLELSKKLWTAYSLEIRAVGIHVVLHPYGQELGSWNGEDPEYADTMTKEETLALQVEGGVEACMKHFIARGGDSSFADARSDAQTVDNWMKAWEIALSANPKWVMTNGYNTGLTNTVHVDYDKGTMDYLRKTLGFEGIIVSDWGDQGDSNSTGVTVDGIDVLSLSIPERYAMVINNGLDQIGAFACDYESDGHGGSASRSGIEEALKQGLISEERCYETCYRVLKDKFEMDLFENPYSDADKALAIAASAEYIANPWEITDTDTLMDKVMKMDLIRKNVSKNCELPPIRKTEMHPLTKEEMGTFMTLAKDDEYYLMMRFDFFTGLRESELIGLTWDCVDFEKHTLRIYRQFMRIASGPDKGKMMYTPLKNGKERTITLTVTALNVLREAKRKQNEMHLRAGSSWHNEYNMIFTRSNGMFVRFKTLYVHFKAIVKRMGRPEVRFHDVRHPYVKHTTKIFSLRLMDFQAQAYPDARRKTRGACQLLRVGQSRSPVRPLCNRKRFSCLPPQSKMSWILYAISMRLLGYTSTRSISSSASSVVSVSASKIALDASMRLSCRACSSCFCFACANTAA